MRRRYWLTVTGVAFAIYTVIAVLGSASTLLYFARSHYAVNVRSFLANRCLEQWTCALFAPVLFWLVERFPLTARTWRRHVPVLAAAVSASIFLKYAIMMPLYRLWAGDWGNGYWLAVLDDFVPVSFDFWAIIGVAHALRYYHAVAERERVAAELKTQLVQARLDALRGQLHPHFLFNTLNAAATLMHEDVDAADRMLSRLGELLRATLDRRSTEIPLYEELELTERYLAIMRDRFSDRLRIECAADASVRNALVPTFLLQPLVENAIEHGIARRPGPGRIGITARRENGVLELAVADDGPGLAEYGSAPSGTGLSNTRARLEHLYGTASAFVLEPVTGGGTRSIVRIPYHECPPS